MVEQAPAVVGARLEDLGVQVEIEVVVRSISPACFIAHSFIELRNTLPSPGAPTKIGMASRWQVASSPGATPFCSSCAA